MEELARLKKDYEKLRKEYQLPEFRVLNEEFEIEKLQEGETEFLLRGIRRMIIEKVGSILRFLELIINPHEGSPMFIFSIAKGISPEVKKSIEMIYKRFTLIEISSLNLDVDYNEKEEAKFIIEMCKEWPEVKKGMKGITGKIGAVWSHEKSHHGYFG